MTVLMGVWGRYPFALAAGLGLNAVVAFQIASQMSWPDAMGLVVLEGLLITLLVLTGLRTAVMDAIPLALKQSIGVGIGLFIAFIGLVDAGFVRRIPDAAGTVVPVELGIGGRLIGLADAGVLRRPAADRRPGRPARARRHPAGHRRDHHLRDRRQRDRRRAAPGRRGRKVTPTGWGLTVPRCPTAWSAHPTSGWSATSASSAASPRWACWWRALFVFTLMLSDFFDTMGTVIGVGNEAGLLDRDGRLPGDRQRAAGRQPGGGRGRRRLLLVQHHLHRVGGRGRRGGTHRPGQRGHRAAVRGGTVPHPAGRGGAVRGRLAGAGGGRLPADGAGPPHPLGRLRPSPSRPS